jgi:(3R)-3-hydroxyacyl-CoA dehydrogenase / 3a,7a,12a-trihydroxy-5b-cholest-24-enoyl-CoA hydratase / enoyl-CoA hydratase 2
MSSELRFDGRVAIVTGAGNGLGRAHALLLGSRGAKVVVNDLGGSMHGGGADKSPAERVVAEIKAAGGDAVANGDSVEAGDKIVQCALDTWKRVDIVVNNAGILRDTSFAKMSDEDWDLIMRVHVKGSYMVTKAAWPHMRDAKYGRIVMTASAAGIYGNFGQTNYAMAKLGLVGFAQTLALEGKKNNVFTNTIAPIAGSRLTETVLPPEIVEALKPEVVSPLVAYLAHESCKENGGTFEVGGGFMAKLRWERTKGKVWANGRPISIEAVEKSWNDITSFAKDTSHPQNIAESMQPILDNVNKKSKGGNDLIDVDQALGFEFPAFETSYDERDLSLYALSVGAAQNPTDEKEVAYVYEMSPRGFMPFPTFAVTPILKGILEAAKRGEQAPGLNYGFERILHGEQFTSLTRPLPPHAKLTHKSKIKDIWDKGKNGVVVVETKSYDETGDLLAENEITMVVRGAGGWGGERGPSGDANPAPERKPDASAEQRIDPQQALLYRLNGDWNPLHADPSFAKNFGFDRPILHGLCTFGYAARHAINAFADGDARLFKSIRARFADSVFPGETIVTEMWKEGDKILVRCKVKERDKVVLSSCAIELYKEVPKPKAKAAPAAAAAAPAATQAITSDLLVKVIGYFVEKNPDLASQVKTSFQFKLTNPDGAFFIDLKDGAGKVAQGSHASPDVTLELSDADFIGMATGKLNPQKLYFGGQLKISGNVMASQKLEFLKKIDGEKLRASMIAEGRLPAGGAAPSSAAAAPADSGKLNSGDIVVAIRDYIEKTPDLAGQIKTSFQFNLKSPDSGFYVDLKEGKGSVSTGTLASPDVTLELSDDDFMAMTTGGADPQKLYFAGKLKIGGNVMASQKLMFLKKVDPKAAEAAIAKARAAGGGGGAAAAPAAPKESKAPGIMKRLGERLAKEPALAKELGGAIGFVVDGKSWLVDGTNVTEADVKTAAAVIKISDADLAELATSGNARDLYLHGKLKIDGDARVGHRLGVFKGLAS